jgi:exodeoxyribonuclease VII small subunit
MSRRKVVAESSLADDLGKLEALVRRLEQDDVELDEALSLFEEGVRHVRAARERLTSAEARIQQVLEQANGDLSINDFTA